MGEGPGAVFTALPGDAASALSATATDRFTLTRLGF
jgi:hypothetical protein